MRASRVYEMFESSAVVQVKVIQVLMSGFLSFFCSGMTCLADALRSNTTLQQILIPTPCGDEGAGVVALAGEK